MVLIIDPQASGLAGNMFIGAFVDLGADKDKVTEVIRNYADEFGEVSVDISPKSKSGVMTTYADIQTNDESARHYEELIDKIDEITENVYPNDTLVKKSVDLAKKIFKTIAVAESEVHGKSLDELHFHEVGCADAVADIIGSSYAYHLLGLDKQKIYSLPVAVGSGTVNTQHGILPVPAPAVINILKNVPTLGGIPKTELTTPTGASILVNITDEYISSQPLLYDKKIGYGAGKKDLEVLNALRLIQASESVNKDSISILETNVDTLSGEVLGSLYDTMLNEGARDISITPTIMKKNRPGHIIKIIARNNDVEHLTNVLMKETGTLGVRIIPFVHRGVSKREIVTFNVDIMGKKYESHFKLGYVDDELIKCSPEYDDVKRISDDCGLSIRDVQLLLEEEYKKSLR